MMSADRSLTRTVTIVLNAQQLELIARTGRALGIADPAEIIRHGFSAYLAQHPDWHRAEARRADGA
jgi:hypothetical protein